MRTTFVFSAIVLAVSLADGTGAVAQDRGCRGSSFSCEDLRYYCELGDQTPYSVRRFCGGYLTPRDRYGQQGYDGGRRGYGNGRPEYQERADRGYDPRPAPDPRYAAPQPQYEPEEEDEVTYQRPRNYNFRELQYYCGLGDQTPNSVRPMCFRFGLW